MNIKKIKIINFRGFSEEKIFEFEGKPFVMLTAPNGKGKTSVIDAIEWCMTGDIKRLHEGYNDRNTNVTERKQNAGAILKNKNHPDEKTIVEMLITAENEEYTIHREQDKDTLDDTGEIKINDFTGEQAEEELRKLIDVKNFYKYHFCDMQKTYRFLSKNRGNIDAEFSDFASDYTDVQNVVDNLNIFEQDLGFRIEEKEGEKQRTEESVQRLRDKLKDFENVPEILPYEKEKLFENENTDIVKMTTEQLQERLRNLYACGYQRGVHLLEWKIAGMNAEKQKNELEKLKSEFTIHEKEIRQAAEKKVYQDDVLKKAEADFEKYQKKELTVVNLEGNRQMLFQIENKKFNKEFWEETEENLKELKKTKEKINNEIQILSRGDEILDILTTLTTKKAGLINYRLKMKQKNPEEIVLCPVCGSEKFDQIAEDDITKQAQSYQIEHRDLIETKKKELDGIKKQENDIWEKRLKTANMALEEARDKAKKELDLVTNLYNASKEYFTVLDKLQKEAAEKFALENMLLQENIVAAIAFDESKILSSDEKIAIETEINRISVMVNETIQGMTDESRLNSFKTKSVYAPDGITYNEELLKKKISSVKSFLDNMEYTKNSNDQKALDEKKKAIQEEIDNYKDLQKNVKKRRQNIVEQMDKMKQEEFEQVGTYLYKLFCKLSRDVQIEKIQMQRAKGEKMAILDESNKPLINMFSDGQLSVFMLSYFFGNIFRLQGSEKFPVYFIDDITSCMDDINMLAFLDLIKYQLMRSDRPMHQIFFVTCNEKIQNLIEYKMENCGIVYKRIGIEEFAG